MATRGQNEEKRTQMSAIIKRLIDQGWTVAQLAAYAGQAVTTINAWKRGVSMGTNDQRELLSRLHTNTENGHRERDVWERVRVHEAQILECDAELQKSPDFGPYRDSVLRHRERIKSWIATLKAVLP